MTVDGIMNAGNGQDDMRVGGMDMQHVTNRLRLFDEENKRHEESKLMRQQHGNEHMPTARRYGNAAPR